MYINLSIDLLENLWISTSLCSVSSCDLFFSFLKFRLDDVQPEVFWRILQLMKLILLEYKILKIKKYPWQLIGVLDNLEKDMSCLIVNSILQTYDCLYLGAHILLEQLTLSASFPNYINCNIGTVNYITPSLSLIWMLLHNKAYHLYQFIFSSWHAEVWPFGLQCSHCQC
jgi:hypothetical protein